MSVAQTGSQKPPIQAGRRRFIKFCLHACKIKSHDFFKVVSTKTHRTVNVSLQIFDDIYTAYAFKPMQIKLNKTLRSGPSFLKKPFQSHDSTLISHQCFTKPLSARRNDITVSCRHHSWTLSLFFFHSPLSLAPDPYTCNTF